MTIASTAALSSGSQCGASVRFSLRPCSRDDDRFDGSTFVWFPAQASVRFSLRPCSAMTIASTAAPSSGSQRSASVRFSLRLVLEDDKLACKRRVCFWIASRRMRPAFSPSFSLESGRSRGHPSRYATTPPFAKKAATSPTDLPAQRLPTQVPAATLEPALCQGPECQREVRRWQAAHRQARRRQNAMVKTRHAQDEKQRRQRAKVAPKAIEDPDIAPPVVTHKKIFSPPQLRSARLLPTPREFTAQPRSLLSPPAARPFATSWTANVSGWHAAPWMAGTSEPSQTRPLAATDPGIRRLPPPIGLRGHLRNDTPPRCAGRQLSRRTGRPF